MFVQVIANWMVKLSTYRISLYVRFLLWKYILQRIPHYLKTFNYKHPQSVNTKTIDGSDLFIAVLLVHNWFFIRRKRSIKYTNLISVIKLNTWNGVWSQVGLFLKPCTYAPDGCSRPLAICPFINSASY